MLPADFKPDNSTVYILRGLPGSGKTHLVNNYIKPALESCYVLSADTIMREWFGRFRPEKLPEVHAECMKRFIHYIHDKSIQNNNVSIIVDNTNIDSWEWRNYALIADYAGWPVVMLNLVVRTLAAATKCLQRNRTIDGHPFPADTFSRMLIRYGETDDRTALQAQCIKKVITIDVQ